MIRGGNAELLHYSKKVVDRRQFLPIQEQYCCDITIYRYLNDHQLADRERERDLADPILFILKTSSWSG